VAIRVKICGINSAAAFDATAEAGADWVGFVFAPDSPRYVTPTQAAGLSRRLPAGPTRVGLFVDPTDDDLARVLETVSLQILQIYAPTPRINLIRAKFDLPVWRALGVATPDDLPESGGIASALVIEPRPRPDAANPGGNGQALDWAMLRDWDPGLTWLLAGGLAPDNVARAIQLSGARAVDVSSGVESERGVKDPALIARFVAAARAEHPADASA
jgi:phosphoribosylanthranilate isomerase